MDSSLNTQFSDLGDSRRWTITYTVLVGINLLLILPFTFFVLRTRSLRDPSRRFLKWLKLAFWLFFITLALALSVLIITTCALHDISITTTTARATYHLAYLTELFRTLSAAATMVFLFELGPGIRHAVKGSFRNHDKLTRYWALFLFFVVSALAIAYYALMVDLNENYSNRLGQVDWFSYGGEAQKKSKTVKELVAATQIILFAAALMIMGVAVWTWMRRRVSVVRSVATMYLVASFLNLISQTWNFAYAIKWLLLADEPHRPWVFVLQAILGWWMRGFLLIIGYLIAKRSAERGGVWSVPVLHKGAAMPGASRRYDGDYRMNQSTY
ncbi:hypothetical protein QBC34DRAFT_418222 [Podospora aff. communis PSN243]|uniref:Uncharacterized protein n=1 Tax=Podospora aff. communis PSN243 TaxID=3040156 RepID=A0AAV9G3V6_9PEZI|nr:hypothetical protein QBC34DRAFT_418222 [Podospora aff. communis PSN243]